MYHRNRYTVVGKLKTAFRYLYVQGYYVRLKRSLDLWLQWLSNIQNLSHQVLDWKTSSVCFICSIYLLLLSLFKVRQIPQAQSAIFKCIDVQLSAFTFIRVKGSRGTLSHIGTSFSTEQRSAKGSGSCLCRKKAFYTGLRQIFKEPFLSKWWYQRKTMHSCDC